MPLYNNAEDNLSRMLMPGIQSSSRTDIEWHFDTINLFETSDFANKKPLPQLNTDDSTLGAANPISQVAIRSTISATFGNVFLPQTFTLDGGGSLYQIFSGNITRNERQSGVGVSTRNFGLAAARIKDFTMGTTDIKVNLTYRIHRR